MLGRCRPSADADRPEQDPIVRVPRDIMRNAFPKQHQRRVIFLIFGGDERTSDFNRGTYVVLEFLVELEKRIDIQTILAVAIEDLVGMPKPVTAGNAPRPASA